MPRTARLPRTTRLPLSAALAVLAALAMVVPARAPAASAADPTPAPSATPAPSPSPTPPIGSPASPMSAHLSGDVYGFLPYWELTSATLDAIDWNALSAIALFSVTQTSGGALDQSLAGYRAMTGSLGRAAVAAAKGRGVRVEICLTSFGLAKNAAFFGDPARQARTIAELVALVEALGADGVNVDVELLENTWFDEYGTFVRRLRAALRAQDPKATVSVATNAGASGARMARSAADAGADRIFVMGYSYRSGGSNPGAVAPLESRGSPGGLDLAWTIDRYAAEGVPLGRVLLGLPYYGRSWPTASAALGAARTGTGTTYLPRKNLDMPKRVGATLRYEPIESVSWFAWYDTAAATWRQVFYDTPRSLAPKYRLAIDRRLAGVGIWALGYDRGAPGYWELLETTFGPPRVSSLAASPALTRATTTGVAVGATAGSRVVTSVRLGRDGTTWGAWVPLPAPTTDAAGQAVIPPVSYALPLAWRDGTYRVYAQVRDEGGTLSAARYVTVTIDRTGPALRPAPTLWFSSTARAWRARWSAATDAHGVAGYRVWVSVNGGSRRLVAAQTTATGIVLPVTSRTARVQVFVRPVDRLGNWGATRSAGS